MRVQTYNPSVGIRRQLPLHRGAYVVSANLQPLSQLRRRLYQGTPTYASADLQPLSQLALTAPLTQGSLLKYVQTYNPSVSLRCQLPLHRGAY